ncbi:helix-turn-helix domain-containing protein [Mycolicibacterium phlei]|jgi:AcrR family transcriptional regulator
MPRPRVVDFEPLMDEAERLAARAGVSAVTIRALSRATSISNGAIYHAFGSRSGLLARVWLRAARRFLSVQRDAVARALEPGVTPATAVDAVVAAAECPATFLDLHPTSARFLLSVRRDELLGDREVPAEVAEELRSLDDELTALFLELAQAKWGRRDRTAVAVIRDCVVELPTALLLRSPAPAPGARERLEAAVRAVLTLDPPTSRG